MARRLGCSISALLDASASLVPFSLPLGWPGRFAATDWRHYPERGQGELRLAIAALHRLHQDQVLVGNGAAELFTWVARDASELGVSCLPQPGFSDYWRALRCWGASVVSLPLPPSWSAAFPQHLPAIGGADVAWITNPHNPTGQLWSRASLEPLLDQYRLVICDEAFLPLVPAGEAQSLIPLTCQHSNLVVIRSLTKLYGIAGLRLGYAVAQPERLQRWASWRDPWPVNAVASALGQHLLRRPSAYDRWCRKVQRWTGREGAWLSDRLTRLPGIVPMPSAANFCLIRGEVDGRPASLLALREALEQRHRILLRDCRSFEGLGESWLRIGYQARSGNRRIVRAIAQELRRQRLGIMTNA